MKSKFPLELTLETARVRIEAISKEKLKDIFQDELLVAFSDESRYFSISNPDDQSMVGWVCIAEKENLADIQYIWLKEEYRSSKVFRESIFAINNFCLNVLKLDKISAKIPIDNTRAKSAFLKGAYIPQTARLKENNQSNIEEFSIYKEEWPLRAVQFFGDIL